MAVDGVTGSGNNAGTNSTGSTKPATDAVKNILGKDDFLKLLITQLKYQDPLEPTDNKDFIAQMAQFSSLEQMNNMATGFEKLAAAQDSVLRESVIGQAVSLLGRKVSAVMPADTVTGTVKDLSTKLYAQANTGSLVVREIPQDTPVTVLGQNGSMYQIKLADGTTGYVATAALEVNDTATVTGVVTGMKLVDDVLNVIVNGTPIPISYIAEVSL